MGALPTKSEHGKESLLRREVSLPIFMRHGRWDETLFVHYEFPPEQVKRLLPRGLELDTLDGKAYVGLVLLTEVAVGLPVCRWLTMTHHGANVRTYVRRRGTPGIYFFSLECSEALVAIGARIATMPYIPATMERSAAGAEYVFSSRRWRGKGSVEAAWTVTDAAAPSRLTDFLVERYYVFSTLGMFVLRGHVHHEPWPLRSAELKHLDFDLFDQAGLPLADARSGPIVTFSPGVGPVDFELLHPC
jgi:uncharacterized protein YqjF (DUF2071 family)